MKLNSINMQSSLSNPDPAELFDQSPNYKSMKNVIAKNSPKKVNKQEEKKVVVETFS